MLNQQPGGGMMPTNPQDPAAGLEQQSPMPDQGMGGADATPNPLASNGANGMPQAPDLSHMTKTNIEVTMNGLLQHMQDVLKGQGINMMQKGQYITPFAEAFGKLMDGLTKMNQAADPMVQAQLDQQSQHHTHAMDIMGQHHQEQLAERQQQHDQMLAEMKAQLEQAQAKQQLEQGQQAHEQQLATNDQASQQQAEAGQLEQAMKIQQAQHQEEAHQQNVQQQNDMHDIAKKQAAQGPEPSK